MVFFTSLLAGFFPFAQEQEEILFIGNSFTFYYNLPSTVEQMAISRDLKWNIFQSTAGGATLKEHWLGQKGLDTKRQLERKPFSRIIYQEHTTYPLIAIDTTAKYLTLLQMVSKGTPKHYLFSTWVYPNISSLMPEEDFTSLPIEKALRKKVLTPSRKILPVGRAFDLFQRRHPSIAILTDDKKHPNANGSYLAACVIFAKLSGLSTKGLLRRKEGKDQKGKKIYYFMVTQAVAEKCQAVADEIVFSKPKAIE